MYRGFGKALMTESTGALAGVPTTGGWTEGGSMGPGSKEGCVAGAWDAGILVDVVVEDPPL